MGSFFQNLFFGEDSLPNWCKTLGCSRNLRDKWICWNFPCPTQSSDWSQHVQHVAICPHAIQVTCIHVELGLGALCFKLPTVFFFEKNLDGGCGPKKKGFNIKNQRCLRCCGGGARMESVLGFQTVVVVVVYQLDGVFRLPQQWGKTGLGERFSGIFPPN